jgi:hypothetical protein
VALPLALALVGTQSAAASTGPEAASATQAEAAAKKCKRPKARYRSRCLGPLRYEQPTDCGA